MFRERKIDVGGNLFSKRLTKGIRYDNIELVNWKWGIKLQVRL